MKPVIGLLLIAGGIMLMYGMFAGKINFPGYSTGGSTINQAAVTQAVQNVTPAAATANALPIAGLPKVSVAQAQQGAAVATALPIQGLHIFNW